MKKVDFPTFLMFLFPLFFLVGPYGILIIGIVLLVYNGLINNEEAKEKERIEKEIEESLPENIKSFKKQQTYKKENKNSLVYLNDPANLNEFEKNYIAAHPGIMKLAERPEGSKIWGVNFGKHGYDEKYWEYYYHYPRGRHSTGELTYPIEGLHYHYTHYICSECLQYIHKLCYDIENQCISFHIKPLRKTTLRCPHCGKDVIAYPIPRDMYFIKLKYLDRLINEKIKKLYQNLLIDMKNYEMGSLEYAIEEAENRQKEVRLFIDYGYSYGATWTPKLPYKLTTDIFHFDEIIYYLQLDEYIEIDELYMFVKVKRDYGRIKQGLIYEGIMDFGKLLNLNRELAKFVLYDNEFLREYVDSEIDDYLHLEYYAKLANLTKKIIKKKENLENES